jgi:hypothetical protein
MEEETAMAKVQKSTDSSGLAEIVDHITKPKRWGRR